MEGVIEREVAKSYLNNYKKRVSCAFEVFERTQKQFADSHPNGREYYYKALLFELKKSLEGSLFGHKWLLNGCTKIDGGSKKVILNDIIDVCISIFNKVNNRHTGNDPSQFVSELIESVDQFFVNAAKIDIVHNLIQPVNQRTFRDYLICENIDAKNGVMSAVNRYLNENSRIGQSTVYLLAALNREGYSIHISRGEIKEFTEILKSMGCNGTRQSLSTALGKVDIQNPPPYFNNDIDSVISRYFR